jgi:hypothetical protein
VWSGAEFVLSVMSMVCGDQRSEVCLSRVAAWRAVQQDDVCDEHERQCHSLCVEIYLRVVATHEKDAK